MLGEPGGGGGGGGEGNAAADDDVDLSAAAYLLSRVGSVLGNLSVEPTISEVSLKLLCHINLHTLQKQKG